MVFVPVPLADNAQETRNASVELELPICLFKMWEWSETDLLCLKDSIAVEIPFGSHLSSSCNCAIESSAIEISSSSSL